MDVRDVLSALPGNSAVRRVVDFCFDELKLKSYEVSGVLRRAEAIMEGLGALEQERYMASGECEADTQQRIEEMGAQFREMRELLDKIAKKSPSH